MDFEGGISTYLGWSCGGKENIKTFVVDERISFGSKCVWWREYFSMGSIEDMVRDDPEKFRPTVYCSLIGM